MLPFFSANKDLYNQYEVVALDCAHDQLTLGVTGSIQFSSCAVNATLSYGARGSKSVSLAAPLRNS